MFFGEPRHYLFKAPMETAEQISRLTWPLLCRHVQHFFPQAWLPEVEEIAFFQLGEMEEVFAVRGACNLVGAWEASLSPFFRQPDAQRHFASLRPMEVTPEDLRRLTADMEEAVAALYKEAIAAAYRKRRWGKEAELRCPPEDLDVAKIFCTVPDFPRLVPYHFVPPQFRAFDLLWLCKRMDWAHEVLVHVYG